LEGWPSSTNTIKSGRYIKAAFENRARIEQTAASQAPLALIRKGKRIALIPFDASPERREQLLSELDA